MIPIPCISQLSMSISSFIYLCSFCIVQVKIKFNLKKSKIQDIIFALFYKDITFLSCCKHLGNIAKSIGQKIKHPTFFLIIAICTALL